MLELDEMGMSAKQVESVVESDARVNVWYSTFGMLAGMECSIDECPNAAKARGWCPKHWRRWRLNGDPLKVRVIRGDDLARLWSKIDKRGPDECWPWLGFVDPDGYGRWRARERWEPAARAVYRLLVGPIPEGLQIDHVWKRGCRRRDCANPAHLEPVTGGENVRRGEPCRRTHCPQGHEYTPENTTLTSGTGRTCVTCNRERSRRARLR